MCIMNYIAGCMIHMYFLYHSACCQADQEVYIKSLKDRTEAFAVVTIKWKENHLKKRIKSVCSTSYLSQNV